MSKRPGDPGYAGNWCIHFRDMSRNDTCEAGVEYASFDGTKHHLRPCFLVEGESRPGALTCPHLRRPTLEEIEAHEAWLANRFALLRKVLVAIGPWREAHKGKSAREVIECPACNGRLHLSIVAGNDRVHGRCETDGCVSWID